MYNRNNYFLEASYLVYESIIDRPVPVDDDAGLIFWRQARTTMRVWPLLPDQSQGGYTVVAGLEHLIDYVHNIHFSEDDLAYLKSTGFFQDEFLEYLKDLRFTGDIYAMPEGTVAFPQ